MTLQLHARLPSLHNLKMMFYSLRKFKHHTYLLYLKGAWFLRRTFSMKIYGLGWTASQMGFEFPFYLHGARFQFTPSAAKSYGYLPAGIPNEPETHQFLQSVLAGRSDVMFIDVGASIGEFVIPMSHTQAISQVLAFEPHHQSREALLKSAQYAPMGKIEIIGKGVSFEKGFANFDFSSLAPTAAGIRNLDAPLLQEAIEICTLDDTVKPKPDQPVVLLIDIEGGGAQCLTRWAEIDPKYPSPNYF